MDERAGASGFDDEPEGYAPGMKPKPHDALIARRDFTRGAAVAAGLVWTAPKITSIALSGQVRGGSGPKTTTTTSTTLPEESSTSSTTNSSTTSTTIHSTGSTTSTTQPRSTTSTTRGNTTTSNSVGPLGSSTTVSPATATSSSAPTTAPATSTPVTNQGNGGGGSGGGKGPLSFTGANTADLLVASAAALATGRTLFWLASRRATDEDQVAPPPDIS